MMNRFLLLVILCVGLAVLRAVAIVLVALAALAVIAAFIIRPRQTLVFLGILTLSALTVAQPIACIVAMATLTIAVVLTRRRQKHFYRRLPKHTG